MSGPALGCWKCGAALGEAAASISRRDECPACRADLHACRMCRFWDPSVARECREPIADDVHDKTRANFCGYFEAMPGAHRRTASPGGEADAARAALDAMFGAAPAAGGDEADEARRALERLFGEDDAKKS